MSCPMGFGSGAKMQIGEPLNLTAEGAKMYREQLVQARDEIRKFIDEENCHPIMVRLAWHDSGTFDAKTAKTELWPAAGGANGSIRFEEELGHGANAGLKKAVMYLKPIKEQFPIVSWADLMQMASAEAIALAGGPVIAMKYGRQDSETCPKEGNLPDALPPFKGEPDAATHLRNVFYRMGFNDKEIVALSGAHTLGRAFKDRSGVVPNGYGKGGTQYTSNEKHVARGDGKTGFGMPGGRSWTSSWLKFDNSYFTEARVPSDDKLLWLPTDDALRSDSNFKEYFATYAVSQEAFFRDYASAHKKLSELGSRFMVEGGIPLPTMQASKM